MKILGITGGVGSGKSEVLKYMQDAYGACVCRMDDTARELQRRGTDCFEQIVRAFGVSVVNDSGELDRKKLGKTVFGDREKLNILNGIVHPAVIREVSREINEKKREGIQLYVVEAALLPDAGRELCDEMWYIYAQEHVRRERLKASRGYTDGQISRMIASQPGEDEFRAACSVVIDNSGPFEDTKRQIGERLKL